MGIYMGCVMRRSEEARELKYVGPEVGGENASFPVHALIVFRHSNIYYTII
jgi:hypothetical protein